MALGCRFHAGYLAQKGLRVMLLNERALGCLTLMLVAN